MKEGWITLGCYLTRLHLIACNKLHTATIVSGTNQPTASASHITINKFHLLDMCVGT